MMIVKVDKMYLCCNDSYNVTYDCIWLLLV